MCKVQIHVYAPLKYAVQAQSGCCPSTFCHCELERYGATVAASQELFLFDCSFVADCAVHGVPDAVCLLNDQHATSPENIQTGKLQHMVDKQHGPWQGSTPLYLA